MHVIALNNDADWNWIDQYAPYVGPLPGGETKEVPITYPIVWDESGAVFQAYNTGGSLLPTIIVANQAGEMVKRYDAANNPAEFWLHLEEIVAEIDSLLANPPG